MVANALLDWRGLRRYLLDKNLRNGGKVMPCSTVDAGIKATDIVWGYGRSVKTIQ